MHVHVYFIFRQFQDISNNKEHLSVSRQAAFEASRKAMLRPHQFTKPCVLTGLATALSPSLAVITRTPMTTAIASTVGSKDYQSKVSCPNSLALPETGTVFQRTGKNDSDLKYKSNGVEGKNV